MKQGDRQPVLAARSETLQPIRVQKNEKHEGKRRSCCRGEDTLPACFLQQHTLPLSCIPILTHTGDFGRTQQNPAAQPAPSPYCPSCPAAPVSGRGVRAGLHSPQSAAPAASCCWAVDPALWPPAPSHSQTQLWRTACPRPTESGHSLGLSRSSGISALTAVVNIWAVRAAGEAAPLMLRSPAPRSLTHSLSSLLLSHSQKHPSTRVEGVGPHVWQIQPRMKKKKGGGGGSKSGQEEDSGGRGGDTSVCAGATLVSQRVLLTALQITAGVLGNLCACVRHRLEQLRAYGAQKPLELQNIPHVSVSCSP